MLVDGEPVHSCIFPAYRAADRAVTTVAGLGTPEDLHEMQRKFVDAAGFQCGFCTAGMIVTTSTFTPEQLADLPQNLKGNLCRCTGYRGIRDALAGKVNVDADAIDSDDKVFGRSLPAPAGPRIVTGTEQYTLDVAIDGLLHVSVLPQPACARAHHGDRLHGGRVDARRGGSTDASGQPAGAVLHRQAHVAARRPR